MLGLQRGAVLLRPHDPAWDAQAAQTIAQLKKCFGGAAVDIQHVGSTAIPVIAAKPILDIAVAVRCFEDVIPLLPSLAEQGFLHRPLCDDQNQILLACGDFAADTRTHHIHVVRAGSMEWRNYLNFRDYLNACPEKARVYEQTKRALADRFPGDRESYTAGKAACIQAILRDALVWSFLGKTVTVTVDRPAGYVHAYRGHTLVYPLNYGFLPGVISGDGEELDVYILGTSQPLTSFTGQIVGIIHRRDDDEDKLVAAPESLRPNQVEIAEAVAFTEQYFDSWIEPLYHKSCGAVVYRRTASRPEVLLLRQRASGSWSFPKGHMEPGESEADTALREIREESGLSVTLRRDFRMEMHYAVPPRFDKTVTLFLAETTQQPALPTEEIAAYRWVSFEEARALLRGNCDRILRQAEALIT